MPTGHELEAIEKVEDDGREYRFAVLDAKFCSPASGCRTAPWYVVHACPARVAAEIMLRLLGTRTA